MQPADGLVVPELTARDRMMTIQTYTHQLKTPPDQSGEPYLQYLDQTATGNIHDKADT